MLSLEPAEPLMFYTPLCQICVCLELFCVCVCVCIRALSSGFVFHMFMHQVSVLKKMSRCGKPQKALYTRYIIWLRPISDVAQVFKHTQRPRTKAAKLTQEAPKSVDTSRSK